jgi:formylglycine-generating enzyme required for sulfatase activity
MADGTKRPHNRPPSASLCWLIALVVLVSLPRTPVAQSLDRPAGAADGGVVSDSQIDEVDDSAKAAVDAPGNGFRDCSVCPEMIVVPAGTFLMGSSPSERGHSPAEAPRRQVTIETPFAISKYEITKGEWQACLAEYGCLDWQSYRHEGAERLPATGLPWKVIPGYLGWLNKKTGQNYRLPTEAEWEYVARAGTTTTYAFGEELTPAQANFGDRIGDPVEVGSYPPNAWGVHDMHGNVGELVDDCWHESYAAPTDGSAWTPDCLLRVVRGGSWESAAEAVRSASRSYDVDANAGIRIGFRVVRTIGP